MKELAVVYVINEIVDNTVVSPQTRLRSSYNTVN